MQRGRSEARERILKQVCLGEGADKEKPTTETEKQSKRVMSITETTRGTSQEGIAEERPGKRIQRAGSYDELGASHKGKKGGLESIQGARGHLQVCPRAAGGEEGDRSKKTGLLPFPWRGLAHRKPAGFIELCAAIQH